MKKIFTSIALIVMFGLTACSGNTAASTTSQETTAAATTQAAESAEATRTLQKEPEPATGRRERDSAREHLKIRSVRG